MSCSATITAPHEIYDLRIDDDMIHVTGEHPFYVVERGWVRVADLSIGDVFLMRDGGTVAVKELTRIQRHAVVYNLTVEGEKNYFVGTSQVLTHNKPY